MLEKRKLAKMHGGLTKEDYEIFSRNPTIALSVTQEILNLRYPSSLYEKILETAGIKVDMDLADDDEPNTKGKFRGLYYLSNKFIDLYMYVCNQ
ncbi:MAG: hypothetical protein OXD44_11265 [Gammaproteobacteria bacterium]|nr:hypothetical protein [Gammaproteobacteria bacterium]